MIVLELRHGLTWQMIKLLVITMPTRGVDSLNQRWDWHWKLELAGKLGRCPRMVICGVKLDETAQQRPRWTEGRNATLRGSR